EEEKESRFFFVWFHLTMALVDGGAVCILHICLLLIFDFLKVVKILFTNRPAFMLKIGSQESQEKQDNLALIIVVTGKEGSRIL
ncbi:hypothetical protein ACJX0J_014494, partial [Zea mays]